MDKRQWAKVFNWSYIHGASVVEMPQSRMYEFHFQPCDFAKERVRVDWTRLSEHEFFMHIYGDNSCGRFRENTQTMEEMRERFLSAHPRLVDTLNAWEGK